MDNVNLTNFSGGMVQRISPDEYFPGEWGSLVGFVPEDDRSIRSQWPIQSVGGLGETWVYDGVANTAHIVSIYPLRGTDGVFLVAVKADGTIWWCKAPSGDATYDVANTTVWNRIVNATNQGYDLYQSWDAQPTIPLELNPDYRFICDLPFEVYKYIRRATIKSQLVRSTTSKTVSGDVATITVGASHGFVAGDNVYITNLGSPYDGRFTLSAVNSTTVSYALVTGNLGPTADTDGKVIRVPDFTQDEVPDDISFDDNGDVIATAVDPNPKSIVSSVLLHSRRHYNETDFTRTIDINSTATITAMSKVSGVVVVTTAAAHGFTTGQSVSIRTGDSNYDGTFIITYTAPTTFQYSKTGANASASYTDLSQYCYRNHYTQTAVIAYIDPYANNGAGGVRAVTFPNVRRWPTYTTETDIEKMFSARYEAYRSIAIKTDKSQGEFPFISKYPFADGSLTTIDPVTARTAYPKQGNAFHPYTILDKNKTLLPGTGFIPRANVGTVFGSVLILGDIEWRDDASDAYLTDRRLKPVANKAAQGNGNSSFGLRDGNTEPHRGFFYYSEDDIDKFDPRSVLRASGSDSRIAGMHVINNRLVAVTTSGGEQDGVIAFAGNFSAIHPYTPGVLANPLAIRKEVIKGGVGTADAEDSYNHGNPQTCLWPEFGRVAFIDKTGYVYTTNGEIAELLDDRFPIKGKPIGATINDHVAAVGKHLFIYKNGFLFCYTVNNQKGAWTVLKRPGAWWQVRDTGTGNLTHYNTIRSMRGIGNELYLVAHSYYQDLDDNYEPFIFNVTNKVRANDVTTLTAAGHNLVVGDLVEIEGVDATIDGQHEVTAITSTTFSFEQIGYTPILTVAVTGGRVTKAPVLGKTRVMRYALNGPDRERGMQDGIQIDGLEIQTPVLGIVSKSKKINWHMAGINFFTDNSASLINVRVRANYPFDDTANYVDTASKQVSGGVATVNLADSASKFYVGSIVRVSGLGSPFDGNHVVTATTATSVSFSVSSGNISLTTDTNGYVTFGYPEYEIGNPIPENASLDTNYDPVLIDPIETYVEGYHNFELQAGVGPQNIIAVKFTFRGDVKVDGVNVWFTGDYNVRGEA